MLNRDDLGNLFRQHGFEDFRWLPADGIVVARWVRMKCQFGCPEYGTLVACPPHNPPVEECERFFREYRETVMFRFTGAVPDPAERRAWSRGINRRLLELERAVFLKGFHKAFLLPMGSCPECEVCTGKAGECRVPGSARPTPEGLAVDLFSTARGVGFPLEVLTDTGQSMNRYAILLVE